MPTELQLLCDQLPVDQIDRVLQSLAGRASRIVPVLTGCLRAHGGTSLLRNRRVPDVAFADFLGPDERCTVECVADVPAVCQVVQTAE